MTESIKSFLTFNQSYIETDEELEKYWKYEDNVWYNMFIDEKIIDV